MSYRMLTRTKGVELENWIKDNLRRIETEMSKPVGGVSQVVSFQPARPTPGGSPALHASTHAEGGSDQVTITLPQIQGISSGILLGRSSLLVGEAQEISVGGGLSLGEGILSTNIQPQDVSWLDDIFTGIDTNLSDKVSKSTSTAQTITSAVTIENAYIGLGYNRNSAFAQFSHDNFKASTVGFCLMQSATGSVFLSSQTGENINVRIGNVNKLIVSPTLVESVVSFQATESATLKHAGTTRIETTTTGAKVTGVLQIENGPSLSNDTGILVVSSDIKSGGQAYLGNAGSNRAFFSHINDYLKGLTITDVGLCQFLGATSSSTAVQIGGGTKMWNTSRKLWIRPYSDSADFEIYGDGNEIAFTARALGGSGYKRLKLDASEIQFYEEGTRLLGLDGGMVTMPNATTSATALQIGGGAKMWYASSVLNIDTGAKVTGNLEVTGSEIYTIPSATSGTINCAGKSVISINGATALGTGTTGQKISVISSGSYVITYSYKSGTLSTGTATEEAGASFICVDGANGYWKQV